MPAQDNPLYVWLHSLNAGDAKNYHQLIAGQLQAARIQCISNALSEDGRVVLVLLDDNTTEEEEKELLREITGQERRVIALYTGEKTLPFFRVWRLLGMGVEDVLNLRENLRLGEAIRARLNRWAVIERILDSDRVKKTLIGNTPAWRRALRQIIEVACFSGAPVLITGESGTGKELAARLIHDLDRRPTKQGLVLLDCTTVVPELSGSEFFGHEKGAFTNALSNRDGAFGLADKGTLFLDEIGEMPLRLQAELLRVIQEGVYKRVGSNIWNKTQFRLICATNRNLAREVATGNFRQDLYYRLSTCVIHLPPLRERKPDIPDLAASFLSHALQANPPPSFDPMVLNFLLAQQYPGNVRQLRQLITRIAYRYTGNGLITIGDLPEHDREAIAFSECSWQENGFREAIREALANGVGLKDIKRITAEIALDLAIQETGGNLQEAARRLNVSDRLVQGYLAGRKQ